MEFRVFFYGFIWKMKNCWDYWIKKVELDHWFSFFRSMNMAFGISSCAKIGAMASFMSLLMSWRIFCFTALSRDFDFKFLMFFIKEFWFADYRSRDSSAERICVGEFGSIPIPDGCDSTSSFSFSFSFSFSLSLSFSFYYYCISKTLS